MNPLETMAVSKQVFTWLCIYPIKNVSQWKQFFHICFTLCVILSNVHGLYSSAIYIFQFISINLPDALYAFAQLFGIFHTLYSFFIALIKKRKMTLIFTKLDEMYRKCKFFLSILNALKMNQWLI